MLSLNKEEACFFEEVAEMNHYLPHTSPVLLGFSIRTPVVASDRDRHTVMRLEDETSRIYISSRKDSITIYSFERRRCDPNGA
jgi:hypothetical protein